ncbi:MAG: penicillin acylase family protein [Planctomycetota bacterium]|nr:penicillin acylase family protein [Planctomycetota bacterium]
MLMPFSRFHWPRPLAIFFVAATCQAQSEVTIWLDSHGVPHIEAADNDSLTYGIGYMHGRDRRFQLELLKFAAAGRLRELVGDQGDQKVLASLDIYSRVLDFPGHGSAMLEAGSAASRATLEAYADGINSATRAEPRAMEFGLMKYRPEPWSARDTAAIMAMVSFGLCKNWQLELGRLELILHQLRTGGSIERALAIWKPRYRLPPHLIGEKPETDPFANIPVIAPELIKFLEGWVVHSAPPRDARELREGSSAFSAHGRGGDRSNNWAMSGSWTGTGKGALSSDPHMPHAMPSLGYLAHIHRTNGSSVIGGCLVGLPTIAFGTNGEVAWGATANWGDVTDLYVEKPVPGNPDAYLFEGKAEAFAVREEIFKIRNRDGSVREEIRQFRSSRHGPLLNDFVDRLPDDFPPVALRYSRGNGMPVAAVLKLYDATDVAEARRAMLEFTAMVGHWVLADAKGNCGYTGPFSLPSRKRHLGTLPVPGWTGAYEWNGLIPAQSLPWIDNPKSGFVGSANNQVVQPESTGYPINFEGDVNHRWYRIREFLASGRGDRSVTEAISQLQIDGVDHGWNQLKGLYGEAIRPLEASKSELAVAAAARELLSWNGDSLPDSPAPTLFNALNAMLVKRMLEDEMSPGTQQFILSHFNIEPFIYDLLRNADNPAWDDRRTEVLETPVEVIASVFREAVDALAARYGKKMSRWAWKRAAPFHIQHPFGSNPLLSLRVNRGPFVARGSSNTVWKHQFGREKLTSFPILYGPVLRVNIDLADLPGSKMVLPGGQSGHPRSEHYDDLLSLYMNGDGVSMDMDMTRIRRAAVEKIELRR